MRDSGHENNCKRLWTPMIAALVLCFATVFFSIGVIKPVEAGAAVKTEVYVLSSIKTPWGYTNVLSYNSKGLLTKNLYGDICTVSYKYNKNNQLTKAVVYIGDKSENLKETYKYSYNDKGLRTKDTHVTTGGSKIVTGYEYNKKKQLIKAGDTQYKYTKGKISSIMPYSTWTAVSYDDYGNVTSDVFSGVGSYDNRYKRGKLVTRVIDNGYGKETVTYTYKKIKVDKKMVKTIKKQQWSLINDDIDSSFNISIGWG